MTKKVDGIIEAVRYKNGQIAMVRAFERRGATFSDRTLLDRKTLLERLRGGKNFATGTRENLLASTFKVDKPVLFAEKNEQAFIATRENPNQDELENVPFF